MRKLLSSVAAVLLSMCSLVSTAQQPQTQPAPLMAINAKYANGVAPGYWVTPGSGLTVNVSGGTAFCGGNVIQYAAGTLSLTANSTNNIYLNTSSACIPTVKTSGFTTSDIPVAQVVTDGLAITSIVDVRTMFTQQTSGGSTPSGPSGAVQMSSGAGALSSATGFTYDSTNGLRVPGVSIANQPQNLWSASAFNTGGNTGGANGIANIQANSGYTSAPAATVLLEPNYTEWDQSHIDIAGGLRQGYLDLRQGYFGFKSINPGPNHNFNTGIPFQCAASTYSGSTYGGSNGTSTGNCLQISVTENVPGADYGAGQGNWSGYQALGIYGTYLGSGIKDIIHAEVSANSIGDYNGLFDVQTSALCDGQRGADESCHLTGRIVGTMGIPPNSGTVYAMSTTPGSVVLKTTAGGPIGGVGQIVLNTNASKVSADDVTGFSVTSGIATLTMASSSYPVSVTTSLTANVPGTFNTENTATSRTFTLNTPTDLTTLPGGGIGQEICFVDFLPECAQVTALGAFSGGTQSVTAMLRFQHYVGYNIYVGGMAGYFVTDDSVTNSGDYNHWKYPFRILGSTANNQLVCAAYSNGGADGLCPAGQVHIYHGAVIADVRETSSSTYNPDGITVVDESNGDWAVNDTAESENMPSGNPPVGAMDYQFLHGFQAYFAKYNPYGGQHLWAGDGNAFSTNVLLIQNGTNAARFNAASASITSFSIAGNVVTFTAANTFIAGDTIQVSGLSTGTYLNGVTFTVSGTGLSNSSFQATATTFTHADVSSTADSGTATRLTLPLGRVMYMAGQTGEFAYFDTVPLGSLVEWQHTPNSGPLSIFQIDDQTAGLAFTKSNDTWVLTGNLYISGTISIPSFSSAHYDVSNGTVGQNVGSFSSDLGALAIGAVNNGIGDGVLELSADKQIRLSTSSVAGFGQGGVLINQYLTGSNGAGLTIRGNADNGDTGSPLILQVSDFNTGVFQTVLQANGVTASGAKAGLSLAPNGGVTTLGGVMQLAPFTVSTLPTCVAGSANSIATVSDASSPTYLGTLTGGGSTVTPALCNGTAWVAY